MDIIIVIIVIAWAIYADKKKKAKKAQESAGRGNRQRPGPKSPQGRTENAVRNVADTMQKNMTQSQRELKERLQKKYGGTAQQGRAPLQKTAQQSAGNRQVYARNPAVKPETGRTSQPAPAARGRRGQQPEAEHNILSRAVSNVQEEAVDELRYEQTNDTAADIPGLSGLENSPLMQQINDLMITGYTGELSFQRDFVAEAVEMLNRCETMEF